MRNRGVGGRGKRNARPFPPLGPVPRSGKGRALRFGVAPGCLPENPCFRADGPDSGPGMAPTDGLTGPVPVSRRGPGTRPSAPCSLSGGHRHRPGRAVPFPLRAPLWQADAVDVRGHGGGGDGAAGSPGAERQDPAGAAVFQAAGRRFHRRIPAAHRGGPRAALPLPAGPVQAAFLRQGAAARHSAGLWKPRPRRTARRSGNRARPASYAQRTGTDRGRWLCGSRGRIPVEKPSPAPAVLPVGAGSGAAAARPGGGGAGPAPQDGSDRNVPGSHSRIRGGA